MKHVKLFEQFVSEGASIFSDSTDKEITLKSEIELMNGQKAKVLAIPDKSNPKYKKGIIIVSAEKGGNQEIDINKDIKNVINEAEFVNEGLSKSEINQIENYLDKYVDEDALFDMCNDFYTDDNEWHDVKNDLDKADLTEWAISCFKTNGFKLKDVKTIFESTVNEAKILTRDEMMATMRSKYGLDFVKTTEEFDGEEGGIWLGGSDDLLMPNAKDMMFNYYHGGSKYPQGVHKDLAKFLDKCGWYGQFYDPGTVMLWPK